MPLQLLQLLLNWCFNAFALLGAAEYVPGIHVDGFMAAFIAAIFLGLVNTLVNPFIRPILEVLMLPLTVVTRGLLILVINGLLFWFADFFLRGFSVDSFWHGVLGVVLYSIFNWVFEIINHKYTPEET
jgi:putative membrane protein